MCGHKINCVRRRHLSRYDKITFIFTIFVIDQYKHPAVTGVFNNFLDRGQVFFIGHALFLFQNARNISRQQIYFQIYPVADLGGTESRNLLGMLDNVNAEGFVLDLIDR